MFIERSVSAVRAGLVVAACGLAAAGAQATPYELVYHGYFTSDEALNRASDALAPFGAMTAFQFNARFDDSTPNQAPTPPLPPPNPFDGFRAYLVQSMTLQVSGMTFSVSVADNPGLTVSIFDQNSFEPGFYGIGIIVDAVADGAGIIGDFASASPEFTVDALTPTTFGGYRGVGHSSGTCITGMPPTCPHNVTPIVMRDSGNVAWHLTLANYAMDPPEQPVNTAQIIGVPEPSTIALVLAGLGGLGLAVRRRRGLA